MELEDFDGHRRPFPDRPRLPDRRQAGDPHRRRRKSAPAAPRRPRRVRSPSRARGRAWRWPAASTSRVATTPNSSNRSGAPTYASRASSSNTSAASTISPQSCADFGPDRGRRLGVLVDHLVAGSKEARIADAVRRGPGGAHTLVVGHPYVDIWQAVKPARLGIATVAGRSRAASSGSTASATRWAGRTQARPTSPRRGDASAAPCGTGTTWSPHSSAASRN